MLKSKLLVVLSSIVAFPFSMTAEAKLYKWVDNSGTTHYDEVVPPEYADKDRDTLKKSGLLNKHPEKLDPDALRVKEESAEKQKIENQAAVELQRRNATLMNTYSNESEIDLARDRSLVMVNARIESNQMLLKSSQVRLDDYTMEVATRTKASRKIPQSLINDMTLSEARVARYTSELAKSEAELVHVQSRFDEEKDLYKKLKGGSAKK